MQQQFSWTNWSGSQQASPQILQPCSIDELQSIVKSQSEIRVVGAGHSFSPLVKTDALLLKLDHLKGVEGSDREQFQSTILAGTRLYQLGDYLAAFNQALINQGDIDQQSLAGAVSTGTHGTGVNLSCLSAFVQGFELLTASGELLQCNHQQNTEIFQAGRVALGSLGVMTKITMQNRPAYKLREHIYLCPLNEIYSHIDQWKHEHRHIEFWAFTHTDQVMLKTLDECNKDEADISAKDSWPSEDALLTLCSELTRIFPASNPWLQKLLGVFVKPEIRLGWSSQIFPAPRNTKFNEMEYQLPVTQGLACLEEMLSVLRKHKAPVFFPIEFRYVKGDDIWLSPFYERDSVSISVHQFYKQDYREIFGLVEPILRKYNGRPHWGKLHTLEAQQLREMYPKWDGFMQIREQLDPERKFINPYLNKLFFSQ